MVLGDNRVTEMEMRIQEARIDRIVLSSVFVSLTVALNVIWLPDSYVSMVSCVLNERITYSTCRFPLEDDVGLLFIESNPNSIQFNLQQPSLFV